jgi:hypothetical protein
MFPRGIPSAALPDAVTSPLRHAAPAPARFQARYHSHPPTTSHPTARRAAVPAPPVPLRFTAARLAAHPQPRRCSAPRPPASCSCLTSCLRPPKIPAATLQESASGASFVSSTSEARAATSGRYGVKCCPRHSRRFLHSLSVVACSLVIPAGSLDPAPCGGKEHLSVLRSQNPDGNQALQNTGNPRAGESPSVSRVPGEVGWASMVQAVIYWRHRAWLQSAMSINPSHPPPLAAAARGVAK